MNRLLLLLVMCLPLAMQAQLSGTYTINPSATATSTNYQSFKSAIHDLKLGVRFDGGTTNGPGVNGAVTFNLADGSYTVQDTIRGISGASATNRITFQSANADSSKVLFSLAATTSSTANYVLWLDSADFFTFRGITLQRTGTGTYTNLVLIEDQANGIRFENCRFIGLPTTSLSTIRASIYGNSSLDSGLVVNNCLFKHNSYGIYHTGSTSEISEGWRITNTTFDSLYGRPVYLTYKSNPLISGNYMQTLDYSTGYGIYLSNCSDGYEISKNIIYMDNASYGIYVTNSDGTSSNPGLVVNNYVNVSSTAIAAVYILNSDFARLYFNTLRINGTSTTASALYLSSSSTSTDRISAYNNIYANFGGGPAFRITGNGITSGYLNQSDNNAYYSTGSNILYLNTSYYNTLDSLKSQLKTDSSSLQANPQFVNARSFRITSAALDSAGRTLAGFTTDIEGQTRKSPPDIGADEFTPPSTDLAITQLVSSPLSCSTTVPISIRVKNTGLDGVDSFTVSYTSIAGASFSQTFRFSLPSLKDTVLSLTSLSLGSSGTDSIKIFTSAPNGGADGIASNDTLRVSVKQALNGTFTIGTGTNSFASISAFRTALQDKGVCGTVRLRLPSGTYTTQLALNNIQLSNAATDSIIIESASGNPADVIWSTPATTSSTENYLIYINNTSGVSLRNMTLRRTDNSTYERVIDYSNGSHRFNMHGNIISNEERSTTSTNSVLIYSSGTTPDTGAVFTNNMMRGGSYAIYALGTSGGDGSITAINNTLDSQYTRGIYVTNPKGVTITNNSMQPFSAYSSAYAIYVSSGSGSLNISRNYIKMLDGSYGIYLSSYDAPAASRGLISNNVINTYSSTASIYLLSPSNIDVVNNTIVNFEPSSTSRVLYGSGSGASPNPNNRLFNNIMIHRGGGEVIDLLSSAVTAGLIDSADNNIYYSSLALPFYVNTSLSFADYVTTVAGETNSIFRNLKFTDIDSLITFSISANDAGAPFSRVTTDFRGNMRSTSTPDIGAYEFNPPPIDLAISNILVSNQDACGDSATTLSVVLRNAGTSDLLNPTATVILAGGAQDTFNVTYSGTLASGASDTVMLSPSFDARSGGTFTLFGLSTLSTDQNDDNDTFRSSVSFNALPANPTVTFTGGCAGDSVRLRGTTTTAGVPVNFYNSIGGDILDSDSFNFLLTGDTTIYYQAQAKASYSVGPADSSIGSGGYRQLSNFLLFDVANDMVLDSIAVHADGPGTFVVDLRNSAGTVLATRTVTVTGGTKEFITLNMNVPAGTGYELDADFSNSTAPDLWRNSSGTNYPYTSTGGVTITAANNGTSFYYYFYDWQYTVAGCASALDSVTINLKDAPTNFTITGVVTNGSVNSGTVLDPDLVQEGDTITYTITPTGAYTLANFGTKWDVTTLAVATASGRLFTDTSVIINPVAGTLSISIRPDSTLADSILSVVAVIEDLVSGCEATYTRTLSVAGMLEVFYTDSNICLGDTIRVMNYSGTVTSTNFDLGNGTMDTSSNPVIAYTTAGTYTITASLTSSAGLVTTQTNTIVVNPRLSVSATVPDTVCQGTTVSLLGMTTGGTASSFSITLPDGSVVNDSTATYTFNSTGTQLITFRAMGTGGCDDSIGYSVTVLGAPASALIIDTVACLGQPFFFNDTLATTSFLVIDGDTIDAAQLPINFTQSGLQSFQYFFTNASGCTDSTSGTIRVQNQAALSLMAPDTICSGDSFNVMLVGNADSFDISFNGLVVDSNMGSFVAPSVNTVPTTFTINANSRFVGNSCAANISRSIVVLPRPVAVLLTDTMVCAGSDIQLEVVGLLAGQTATVTIDDTLVFTTSPINFRVDRMRGPISAVLQVSNNNGCSIMDTTTIMVDTSAVAGFMVQDACVGDTVLITGVTGDSATTYFWSFGDGDTMTGNPLHAYATAGTYTITQVVTNGQGCSDSASRQVRIYLVPQANFIVSSVCIGEDLNISNNTTGDSVIYSVRVQGNGIDTTAVSDTPNIAELGIVQPGQYTVTLFASNVLGCGTEVTRTFSVLSPPDTGFVAEVDSFRTVTATANATGAAGYAWSWGDTTAIDTTRTAEHTYMHDGMYTITLTVTNDSGCTSITSRTLDIRRIGIFEDGSRRISISAYPNPLTSSMLNVEVNAAAAGRARLSLMGIDGKLIQSFGTQNLSGGSNKLTLDVPGLASGVYLLNVEINSRAYQLRIIKQ